MLNSERPTQFHADLAEIVASYDAGGFKFAERVFVAIRAARRLDSAAALTLADAFRRYIILR